MNAEQVVDKILSQAKAEAEQILKEAKEKASEQKSQLDAELSAFEKDTEKKAREAGEDKLQRMLAAARMSQAKQVLAAKVAILDEVFARAKEAVHRLPDDQYLALMAELMKKAVETGDETIIVGRNENRLNNDFIKRINRELGAGFKGNLRLASERADIPGGFIVSRGKVRMIASTDVLVSRLRESMQVDLAKELFE